MGVSEGELINRALQAGHKLAIEQGHEISCRFSGCTCGAIERQKEAMLEVLKLWRKIKHSL